MISWKANFHVFFAATCLWIGIAVGGIAQGDAPTIFLRDCWTAVLMAYITCLMWWLSKAESLRTSN